MNEVLVTVTLSNGATFHDTNSSQHHALVFNLASIPSITISGLSAPFTANGSQSAGAVSAAGFGSFDYVVNFPKVTHPPVETTFSFDVTAPGLTLNSFISNSKAFFASDVWAGPGQKGNTGNIAAPSASISTPKPASWALMLMGFGGLGGAIRSRRKAAVPQV